MMITKYFKFVEFFNEGISYVFDKKTDVVKVVYKPERDYNINTKIFKKTTDNKNIKEFNYKIYYLPKTEIKSINLYNLDSKFSGILKHKSIINKDGEKSVVFDDSMIDFSERNYRYVSNIINHYFPGLDYIFIPQSSSDFNKEFINNVKEKLYSKNLKIYDDFFIKKPENIKIDDEYINKIGITDEDLIYVKQKLHRWKLVDDPIRKRWYQIIKIEKEIDDLKIEKENEEKSNKEKGRGRPSLNYLNVINNIKSKIEEKSNQLTQLLNEIKYFRQEEKGKDSVITRIPKQTLLVKNDKIEGVERNNDGTIKITEWKIKSLPSNLRLYIDGFLSINPKYDQMIHKLENKTAVIFDDNLNTGSTVEQICTILLKNGINKEDILVITLGLLPDTSYGGNHKPKLKD